MRIPGLPLWIDTFSSNHSASPLCSYGDGVALHIVSHFHMDHLVGMHASWCDGIIFCSEITRALVLDSFRLPAWRVLALPFGVTIRIPVAHPHLMLDHSSSSSTKLPLGMDMLGCGDALVQRFSLRLQQHIARQTAVSSSTAEEDRKLFPDAVAFFSMTFIEAAHIPGSAMIIVDLDEHPSIIRQLQEQQEQQQQHQHPYRRNFNFVPRRLLYTGDFRIDGTQWDQHEVENYQRLRRSQQVTATTATSGAVFSSTNEVTYSFFSAQQQQQFDEEELQSPALAHLLRFIRRSRKQIDVLYVDTTWLHIHDRKSRQSLLNIRSLRIVFQSVVAAVLPLLEQMEAREAEAQSRMLETARRAERQEDKEWEEGISGKQPGEGDRDDDDDDVSAHQATAADPRPISLMCGVPFIIRAYLQSHFGKEVLLQGLARRLRTRIAVDAKRFRTLNIVAEIQRMQLERRQQQRQQREQDGGNDSSSDAADSDVAELFWNSTVDMTLFECCDRGCRTDAGFISAASRPPCIQIVSFRKDVDPSTLARRQIETGIPHFGLYLTGWSALRKRETGAAVLGSMKNQQRQDREQFDRQDYFRHQQRQEEEAREEELNRKDRLDCEQQQQQQQLNLADGNDDGDDEVEDAETLSCDEEEEGEEEAELDKPTAVIEESGDNKEHVVASPTTTTTATTTTTKFQNVFIGESQEEQERREGVEEGYLRMLPVVVEARVWSIPFSLHSSRGDTERFVAALRPHAIFPLSGPAARAPIVMGSASISEKSRGGADALLNESMLLPTSHLQQLDNIGGMFGASGLHVHSENRNRAHRAMEKCLFPLLRQPGMNRIVPPLPVLGAGFVETKSSADHVDGNQQSGSKRDDASAGVDDAAAAKQRRDRARYEVSLRKELLARSATNDRNVSQVRRGSQLVGRIRLRCEDEEDGSSASSSDDEEEDCDGTAEMQRVVAASRGKYKPTQKQQPPLQPQSSHMERENVQPLSADLTLADLGLEHEALDLDY